MNLNVHKGLPYLLTPVLFVSLVFTISIWSPGALAHKGHAGSMINFIKNKVALKEMLPSGAKIVKRKQPLKDDAIQWAKTNYDVDLDNKVYSYYLATSKASGSILGAAYVAKGNYRHGDLKYAVGIDANGRITQAAILGVNEKYVVDFDGNVGTGLIADYAGLSLNELIAKADELASSDKATREFAFMIRDAAVLLRAFTK